MSKRLHVIVTWDMIEGFYDRYKRSTWPPRRGIRKLKYLLFVFMDSNKKVIRIKDAPLETGKIYLDEYIELKNGYIYVYLNQVNDNNLLLSKRVVTLEEPSDKKYISIKNITKVSSDPVDCKYEWQYDGDCSTTCGTGRRRKILRITERQLNGGLPCNVSDYGNVRYSQCTETSGCLIRK
jgi:hypothetical protein